jgi:sensor histidine kinase YesM
MNLMYNNAKKRDSSTYHSKIHRLTFFQMSTWTKHWWESNVSNNWGKKFGIFFKASSSIITSISPSLGYMITNF